MKHEDKILNGTMNLYYRKVPNCYMNHHPKFEIDNFSKTELMKIARR